MPAIAPELAWGDPPRSEVGPEMGLETLGSEDMMLVGNP
ncbi:hypothetical protein GFS31_20540 [Leptolyngbya sp. BL0902]|nr:hypothetical protein GFS31_20540 [Leptolyngbya sp. BL0902]